MRPPRSTRTPLPARAPRARPGSRALLPRPGRGHRRLAQPARHDPSGNPHPNAPPSPRLGERRRSWLSQAPRPATHHHKQNHRPTTTISTDHSRGEAVHEKAEEAEDDIPGPGFPGQTSRSSCGPTGRRDITFSEGLPNITEFHAAYALLRGETPGHGSRKRSGRRLEQPDDAKWKHTKRIEGEDHVCLSNAGTFRMVFDRPGQTFDRPILISKRRLSIRARDAGGGAQKPGRDAPTGRRAIPKDTLKPRHTNGTNNMPVYAVTTIEDQAMSRWENGRRSRMPHGKSKTGSGVSGRRTTTTAPSCVSSSSTPKRTQDCSHSLRRSVTVA